MEIREVSLPVVWQMRHEIMYPTEALEVVKLEKDEEGIHRGLYEGDRLISVISVYLEGKDLQFRKFCTLVQEQGKGYGTQLLRYVFEEMAQEYQAERIWCNARTTAIAIYERFGMSRTDQTYSKLGHDFVVMEKHLA